MPKRKIEKINAERQNGSTEEETRKEGWRKIGRDKEE